MNKIYNEKTKEITIHLVSDSTSETIGMAVAATIAQFPTVKKKELVWPLIRTERQIKDILENLKKKPGLVVLSLLDKGNKRMLELGCHELRIPFISPLDDLFKVFKDHTSLQQTKFVGGQHKLDDDYFLRINALDYAMQHDDGQSIKTMNDSDVILVGISRTSKTPTSIYLANKGYKVANLPLIINTKVPEEFFNIKRPLIIGLLKDPKSLSHIRETRLKVMGEYKTSSYSDLDNIKQEHVQARDLFEKKNWPVIDVTRRSVEETAASIIKIINESKKQ